MNVCSDSLFILLSIMCCFGSSIDDLKSSSFKSNNIITDSGKMYASTEAYSQPVRFDPSKSRISTIYFAASNEVCNEDPSCMLLSTSDRQGLEAIRSLHKQLDDDANGAVDLSESDDFLREELQYESGAERRQKAFHRNDDMHISVKELWEGWVRSEVHNWTVEQTTEWLSRNVGLPQYVPIFILNGVTGATLPRLAVNNMQFLNNVLGIKDPIHKQKIALKAMDVVLFGPPKETSHYIKDIILISLLLSALIGCWLAYRINKRDRRHLKRMMKDMESLHKAELALTNLQKELEQARIEQESATTEKQNLEKRLLEQSTDVGELKSSFSDLEVSQLKAEIEMLRNELQRAEGELEDRCWSPPVGLQQWLQLTHELENKSYLKKKVAAEKQLQSARDACEKLKKKRSSLVGAFVSTHGKSIDEVDRSIVEARTALNEVTQELAERVHRWKQIEILCGFNIINNSGLAVLESVLYKTTPNGRSIGLKGRTSSHDDLEDDNSIFLSEHGLDVTVSGSGCADSSESEKMDGDDDESPSTNVEFTLGISDVDELMVKQKRGLVFKDSSELLTRSQSHDTTDLFEQDSIGPSRSVGSASDLSTQGLTYRQKRSASSPKSEAIIGDDEAYSTDSNSTAADDIGTFDKKKNKLRFPKFSRKSKSSQVFDKYT